MPRYARKELPAGFALREFADKTFQAYRLADPKQESPRYTRRIQAVDWCLLKLGEESVQRARGVSG